MNCKSLLNWAASWPSPPRRHRPPAREQSCTGAGDSLRAASSSRWETWAAPALLYAFQQLLSQGNHVNKARDKRDKAHRGNWMKLKLRECRNIQTWQTCNVNSVRCNWASELAVKGTEDKGKKEEKLGKREARNNVLLGFCMQPLQ